LERPEILYVFCVYERKEIEEVREILYVFYVYLGKEVWEKKETILYVFFMYEEKETWEKRERKEPLVLVLNIFPFLLDLIIHFFPILDADVCSF
jgi:hypothetical protein